MSIPQRPPAGANPPQNTVYATLRAAARDSQVTRAGLAVLLWFASDTNAWQTFTVTALASAEVLNVSRNTISRALGKLERRGYLEERVTRRKPGEREARLSLSSATPGATR